MNALLQQTRHSRSTRGKVLIALTFASVISALSISPALAEKNNGHGRGNRHDNRQSEWRGDRQDYRYQTEYRHPYLYAQPVYVPPPVYYESRQSPGISLFFPLDFRR